MTNITPVVANAGPRRAWREIGRLALESLATGLIASLALALAVFIISFEARAATGDADGMMWEASVAGAAALSMFGAVMVALRRRAAHRRSVR